MSEIKLVNGGVYWVRPTGIRWDGTKRVEVIMDEPVLAQYRDFRDDDDDDDDQGDQGIYYFGTDWFDRPRDVIIVAGPLEIPSPPGPGEGQS